MSSVRPLHPQLTSGEVHRTVNTALISFKTEEGGNFTKRKPVKTMFYYSRERKPLTEGFLVYSHSVTPVYFPGDYSQASLDRSEASGWL